VEIGATRPSAKQEPDPLFWWIISSRNEAVRTSSGERIISPVMGNMVRYADDIVVTETSKELLEEHVKPLKGFMAERGLSLSVKDQDHAHPGRLRLSRMVLPQMRKRRETAPDARKGKQSSLPVQNIGSGERNQGDQTGGI
jgi:hypothetical protein